MQAVIRKYAGKGATELFELLEKRRTDLETEMRSVQGFVSYTLIRTAAGGMSITVCRDQAGIDESTRKAKEWVAKNAAHIAVAPPEVSAGSVIAHLK